MAAASNKKSKSKLKIAVFGASGRMGQEISVLLSLNPATEAYLAISKKSRVLNFTETKSPVLNDGFLKAWKNVDAVIDFSHLDNFYFLKKVMKKHPKPLICGVTGLEKKHFQLIDEISEKTPVLWSSNMSLGVAALKKALQVFAKLPKFDFQIVEFHHKHKKDNPSGTAKTLQKELVKHVGSTQTEPMGIRGGGIFGVHQVYGMSEDEVICFEHQALNRRVFAEGAVSAAQWIHAKKPGLYTMEDFLE